MFWRKSEAEKKLKRLKKKQKKAEKEWQKKIKKRKWLEARNSKVFRLEYVVMGKPATIDIKAAHYDTRGGNIRFWVMEYDSFVDPVSGESTSERVSFQVQSGFWASVIPIDDE